MVIAAVAALDQFTKFLVKSNLSVNEAIPVIKNFFNITYITNTGSAFGTFQNFNLVLIFVSLIAIGLILFFWDRMKCEKILYAVILGGIIGNLLDRVFIGRVTDFIYFSFFPAFNVADSAISVGVVLLIIYYWKND